MGGSLYIMMAVMSNVYLGTYWDLPSCQNAIRERMVAQMAPPQVLADPKNRAQVLAVVDRMLPIQNDYICVPKEVDKR